MNVLSGRTVEGRKTVTVLFCDLVAYTELAERLDPEALRLLMLRFFERAAAVIEGHGGTVEKFVGDEVMAVFGVPVVHEDDALRAVRAAVAVQKCVAELDRDTDVQLEVRVGINTGEVMTGDPSAGHGFVSGDPVAVGKRLEQAAAPGEIVVGESTHRLVEHAVQATQLEPLTLKGKTGEAVAFRLESVDPAATAIPRRHDTPLVGQEQELERLHSAYREAASGGVRLVTIVGDSGIGKSRLARELVTGLAGEASVVVSSCPPYGEGTTFSPIREAFRAAGRDEAVLEGSSYEVFAATRSLFDVLRVAPALGRTFNADEDKPGGPHAVILSHALWRQRFGGDPSVLGRTIQIDWTSNAETPTLTCGTGSLSQMFGIYQSGGAGGGAVTCRKRWTSRLVDSNSITSSRGRAGPFST